MSCCDLFSLNTRFGVVAVPTILLFHSGKPVLKFNNSITLDDLRMFVKNNTGKYIKIFMFFFICITQCIRVVKSCS